MHNVHYIEDTQRNSAKRNKFHKRYIRAPQTNTESEINKIVRLFSGH